MQEVVEKNFNQALFLFCPNQAQQQYPTLFSLGLHKVIIGFEALVRFLRFYIEQNIF